MYDLKTLIKTIIRYFFFEIVLKYTFLILHTNRTFRTFNFVFIYICPY